MTLRPAITSDELKLFLDLPRKVYKNNACYRKSNNDVASLFFKTGTLYKSHAQVWPYLIMEGKEAVGRFALLHDFRNSAIVMLSFFEALPGLEGLTECIVNEVRAQFPSCEKLVAGLDGHLNNGAGILLGRYDETPAYGLPYTPPWYPDYFKDFGRHLLFTFMVPVSGSGNKFDAILSRAGDVSVRPADKSRLRSEISLYTRLNNDCYRNHIYWSLRDKEEDEELFLPMQHLLEGENLLFAEYKGEPIGFLLWFPDFSQLVNHKRAISAGSSISSDVLRFRFFNPVSRIRLAEIAILPGFHKKCADLLMLDRMYNYAYKKGYRWCEGGFISENNPDSLNMTRRYIERMTGRPATPYRTYAVFEKKL